MFVMMTGSLATMHGNKTTRLQQKKTNVIIFHLYYGRRDLSVRLRVSFDLDLTPSFWKPTPRSMHMRVTARK